MFVFINQIVSEYKKLPQVDQSTAGASCLQQVHDAIGKPFLTKRNPHVAGQDARLHDYVELLINQPRISLTDDANLRLTELREDEVIARNEQTNRV